jgi:hypothetical protein
MAIEFLVAANNACAAVVGGRPSALAFRGFNQRNAVWADVGRQDGFIGRNDRQEWKARL